MILKDEGVALTLRHTLLQSSCTYDLKQSIKSLSDKTFVLIFNDRSLNIL